MGCPFVSRLGHAALRTLPAWPPARSHLNDHDRKRVLVNMPCGTRALKVLKYLHRTIPETIPRASARALEELPPEVLSNLHSGVDVDRVVKDPQLREWL